MSRAITELTLLDPVRITITAEFLVGRRFQFKESNGYIIIPHLVLGLGGIISGATHPNESSWSVHSGNLVFRDASDVIKTEFYHIELVDTGCILRGRFLENQDTALTHLLVELPPYFSREPKRISTPDYSQRKVATIVRGHKLDSKTIDLFLAVDGSSAYDTFLLLDETSGPKTDDLAQTRIEPEKVITFSEKRVVELGLKLGNRNLFWLCGDIALYFAVERLPSYTYFIMIDYDVHFLRSGKSLLENLVAAVLKGSDSSIDAVGLEFHEIIGESWPFKKAASRIFDKVMFFYFPFVMFSRRALSYLHAQRVVESARETAPNDVMICEAFSASYLVSGGFRCVDLNELVGGAYRSSSMRLQPIGRPLGADFTEFSDVEMIHAVYSPEDHLERRIHWCKEIPELVEIQSIIEGDTFSLTDEHKKDLVVRLNKKRAELQRPND